MKRYLATQLGIAAAAGVALISVSFAGAIVMFGLLEKYGPDLLKAWERWHA